MATYYSNRKAICDPTNANYSSTRSLQCQGELLSINQVACKTRGARTKRTWTDAVSVNPATSCCNDSSYDCMQTFGHQQPHCVLVHRNRPSCPVFHNKANKTLIIKAQCGCSLLVTFTACRSEQLSQLRTSRQYAYNFTVSMTDCRPAPCSVMCIARMITTATTYSQTVSNNQVL